jgi:hypothetical protein
MHAAGDFGRLDHTAIDVLTHEIAARIRWHRAIEGEIPSLRADNDFIALDLARFELRLQRHADVALRMLVPVIDCSIEDIDTGAKSGFNGLRVKLVAGLVRLAQVGAETN